MDVESCIEAYTALAEDIFTPRNRTMFGGAFLHKVVGSATFSAEKLEAGIKKVIRDSQDRGNNADRAGGASGIFEAVEDLPMLRGDRQKCRVCICLYGMENNQAYRIRSYESKNEPGLPMTVWQAARATSAAPTLFNPIAIGNTTTLRDGGLRNNNPIMEVMEELEHEFYARGSDIACIVSIGTGVSKTDFFQNRDILKSVAEICAKIATDTKTIEATFRNVYAAAGKPLRERYFRFEVDQGLRGMGMEEWKKMSEVFSVTTTYLSDGARREAMGKCAATLAIGNAAPQVE
ncbi:acyl transferase/acyl hydrolase/lysophospholipase [Immersiella caudata]|uniref:Acyl transferase/acyl hydrolase/lysophospholipase n=1 Tax=Immersiella caudata TaxID=314043 RepID=A0AA40C3H5_9PEZI|nr:acyl transferase/acyl hydrolase/lysophospholipase [Immersiella caudata]